MHDIDLLLAIAEAGGMFETVLMSTTSMAEMLGISQQAVSNKLRKAESLGLIDRRAQASGTMLGLNEEGRNFLLSYKVRIEKAAKALPRLAGKVATGIGEGKFYTQIKGYRHQFIGKLGIDPYPGTLNIEVNQAERLSFLFSRNPVKIDSFSSHGRTFGEISAYPVRINKLKTALIIPERTRHDKDIVEVISGAYLREKLCLKDKDKVILE